MLLRLPSKRQLSMRLAAGAVMALGGLVAAWPVPCLAGEEDAAPVVEAAADPLASEGDAPSAAAGFIDDPIVPPVRRVMPKTPATLPATKPAGVKPAGVKASGANSSGAKTPGAKTPGAKTPGAKSPGPATPADKATAASTGTSKSLHTKPTKDAGQKAATPSAPPSAGAASATPSTKAAEKSPKPPEKPTVKR